VPTWGALRHTGLSTRAATRTLLSFLVLLYSVFLATLVVAGGVLALGLAHSDAPRALGAVPATAAGLAIVAALAIAAATRGRDHAPAPAAAAPSAAPPRAARVLRRVRETTVDLGAGVRGALALVRTGDPRLLGAVAWWALDAGVLWAMLHAFGRPPGLAVLALAYVLGQVGNTLPIPGAVSGGIAGALIACGTPAGVAVIAVLAYRTIAIWIPAPIGLAALAPLRRTLAAWGAASPPSRRARRGACQGAVSSTCPGVVTA
jgi:uncharacterized membrane protein YbhN (UPF0104 family)